MSTEDTTQSGAPAPGPAPAPADDKRVVHVEESGDGSALITGFEEGLPKTTAPAPAPAAQTEAAPATDDDEAEDAIPPLQDGEDPNDPEVQKRMRRRDERKKKRERINGRFELLQSQILARDQIIDEMRQRLEVTERRSGAGDIARIDARLKQEREALTYLTSVIADGTKSQNGEAVAQATLALNQTQQNISQLERIKQTAERAAATPPAPQLDPRMVVLAGAWMRENPWYNPRNPDADTRQVMVLDQRLAEEGFAPNTPAYWQELSRRVQQHLPHRRSGAPAPVQADPLSANDGYNAGASQRKPDSRSVVAGSGQDGLSAPSGRTDRAAGYVLSPQRVQALKDAGMWNDPHLRDQAIRRYREYDNQQKAG
jgi:hypothetical protein